MVPTTTIVPPPGKGKITTTHCSLFTQKKSKKRAQLAKRKIQKDPCPIYTIKFSQFFLWYLAGFSQQRYWKYSVADQMPWNLAASEYPKVLKSRPLLGSPGGYPDADG